MSFRRATSPSRRSLPRTNSAASTGRTSTGRRRPPQDRHSLSGRPESRPGSARPPPEGRHSVGGRPPSRSRDVPRSSTPRDKVPPPPLPQTPTPPPPVVPVMLDDSPDSTASQLEPAAPLFERRESIGDASAGAGGASSSANNCMVVCRFRPLNAKEIDEGSSSGVRFDANGRTVEVAPADRFGEPLTFHFDRVFGFDTTQAELYDHVAKPVVEGLFEGYNGTVFAYGQTSSGKTHTMQGPDIDDEKMKGIVPRIVHTVMEHIEKSPESLEFTLKVSMVEIYLEKIRDLLDVSRDSLEIRESKDVGVYLDGCSEVFVNSPEVVYEAIRAGTENRATAATAMNDVSSRSHSVFVFTVVQKNLETLSCLTGKLYLVDLAGSERIKKTNASGTTLEQAKKINSSLSALGNVINALTDGKSTHVPYRDSKLTRLLQESLGGNSRTALIMNCSPAESNREETVSTLRFGVRAKRMVNKPKVNKEMSYTELRMLLELRDKEIMRLKARIKQLEGGDASGGVIAAGDGGGVPGVDGGEVARLRQELGEEREARAEIESQLEEMVGTFVTRVEREKLELQQAHEEERRTLEHRVAELEAGGAGGAAVADLEDEVKILTAALAEATTEVDTHRTAHDQLLVELKVLRESLTAVDVDTAEGGGAGGDDGEAAVDMSGFTVEPAQDLAALFNAKLADSQAKRRQVETMLESTSATVLSLQQDLDQANAVMITRCEELATERATTARLTAAATDTNARLLVQAKDLQAAMEQLADAEETVTSLTSELDTSKASARALSGAKEAAVQQAEHVQAQLHAVKASMAKLQEEHDVACRDRDRASKAAADTNALVESLQGIAEETTALDQQSQVLKAQLEAAQASLRTSKEAAAESDASAEAARGEAAKLRSHVERMLEENGDLRRQIDVAEGAHSNAVVRATTAEAKSGEAERLMRAKQGEVDRIQAELDGLQAAHEQTTAELAGVPGKIKVAQEEVAALWQQKLDEAAESLETEWRTKKYEWDRDREELQTSWDEEREALQSEVEATRQQMEEDLARAVASETGAATAQVEDLQRASRSQVKRLEDKNGAMMMKNRELKQQLTRARRQRNMAVGEVNNRKLEIEILRSTTRALEMRLELVREDMQAAAASAVAPSPIHRPSGTPRQEPGGDDSKVAMDDSVRDRVSALEDTMMHQMKQLQEQGSKMMDMEWREQQILRDLRDRCAKVVDLQQALEEREEQVKHLSARKGKREKGLQQANDVLRQSLSKAEDRANALGQAVSELSQQKQRLELKVARLSAAAARGGRQGALRGGAAVMTPGSAPRSSVRGGTALTAAQRSPTASFS